MQYTLFPLNSACLFLAVECLNDCSCILWISMPIIERESVRIYLSVCMLGCECSVVESYFNYLKKCMNEAKPTSFPCVLLPLGYKKNL